MFISIVVPCYNEEAVIGEMHKRLIAVLREITPTFEIIYVDDGSKDSTVALLRDLQNNNESVKVILLSRNFGHQYAVSAGMEHASGDAVVLIDADLQDPPEIIKEMVTKWRTGYDLVYGLRTDRAGETAFKRWTAKAFYRIYNRLSDVHIPLDTGDFRLMDRKVVDVLNGMPERDRFIRGMVSWIGSKQAAVPYSRAQRFAGTSNYKFSKMISFAADGIFSSSLAPLRLAFWAGLSTAGLSVIGILYVLVRGVVTNTWVPGWSLLFIALLFLGGGQLMFLGVIGEYIGRVYREGKRRPLYIVSELLGFEREKEEGE